MDGRSDPWKLLIHAVLWISGVLFVLPLVWMLSTSLKTPEQLKDYLSLPWPPQFGNYVDALANMNHFWRFAWNTLFLCTMNIVGVTLSSAMAAYGLSQIQWRGLPCFVMTQV